MLVLIASPRALQRFLAESPWDDDAVRRCGSDFKQRWEWPGSRNPEGRALVDKRLYLPLEVFRDYDAIRVE